MLEHARTIAISSTSAKSRPPMTSLVTSAALLCDDCDVCTGRMNSDFEMRSFWRLSSAPGAALGSIEPRDHIVGPDWRDVREIKGLLHIEHQLEHARGRKGKLLDPPLDGVGDSAGDCCAHIENRNFARALGAEWANGGSPLIKIDQNRHD